MKNRIISGLLATLLLFIVWHMGSLVLAKPFLPTPGASLAAFGQLIFNGGLTKHFLISAARIFISILISMALAVPLGLLMGRSANADRFLRPLVYILYPLPKVVFLPVIVVLLGLGNAPKILLITLVIFFQITVVARDAAKAIPPTSVQSMRSLNASRWQTFCHLILPYCLPDILTSLRVSLGTAIAVLFFAETFASFDGLGYFILEGMETRNYPSMYGGIIGLALLGVAFYLLVDVLEKSLCKWQ